MSGERNTDSIDAPGNEADDGLSVRLRDAITSGGAEAIGGPNANIEGRTVTVLAASPGSESDKGSHPMAEPDQFLADVPYAQVCLFTEDWKFDPVDGLSGPEGVLTFADRGLPVEDSVAIALPDDPAVEFPVVRNRDSLFGITTVAVVEGPPDFWVGEPPGPEEDPGLWPAPGLQVVDDPETVLTILDDGLIATDLVDAPNGDTEGGKLVDRADEDLVVGGVVLLGTSLAALETEE